MSVLNLRTANSPRGLQVQKSFETHPFHRSRVSRTVLGTGLLNLPFVLQLMEPWMTSPLDHERARAVETAMRLLKFVAEHFPLDVSVIPGPSMMGLGWGWETSLPQDSVSLSENLCNVKRTQDLLLHVGPSVVQPFDSSHDQSEQHRRRP